MLYRNLKESPMNKLNSNEERQRLYDNLKTLSDTTFPKKCSCCGRVFNSPDDFITSTEAMISGSGLKSSLDDNDISIIELFRNCLCGSTLMNEFCDRRDTSPQGEKRREAFGNTLNILETKGIPSKQARVELNKLLRGEQSEVLEKIGITFGKLFS